MAGFPLWRTQVRDDVLRELCYTAREFDAAAAQGYGFVSHLADDPRAAALALAAEIAARSPHAVRAAKRLANEAHDTPARKLLERETEEQVALLRSPNMMESVRANMESRAPVFAD